MFFLSDVVRNVGSKAWDYAHYLALLRSTRYAVQRAKGLF